MQAAVNLAVSFSSMIFFKKEEQNHMPRKILIIEDDKDIAHLVELHLKDEGYEVSRAYDGKAGLELALSKPYDLIILDLMLPGVGGIEICRRVRASSF